jgi:hypothetical protein
MEKIQIKHVLFDANIFLDIICVRGEHYRPSTDAFAAAKRAGMTAYISAASFNVISYVGGKILGKIKTLQALEKIRLMCDVAKVDAAVVDKALISDFNDFEDALQFYSASDTGAQCVVTRDKKGYKQATRIPVLSPEEFVCAIL